MSQLPFAKYDAEFRKDHPETIGETDQAFDRSNYCEWLETRVADRDRLASDLQATRAELERVRRNHLRRMAQRAEDLANRMSWRPLRAMRYARFAERCRADLATMETGRA